MKQTYVIYNVIIIMILFFGSTLRVKAKNYEASEQITKELNFSENPLVDINLYYCETEFRKTTGNTIKVELRYRIEAEAKEDAMILKKEIEKYILKGTNSNISISSLFYKQRKSNLNKVKFILNSGRSVKLEDFHIMSLVIYLPEKMKLNTKAKYGSLDIKMDIDGKTKLDLFDVDLMAQTMKGEFKLDSKYSNIKLLDLPKTTCDLFECKVIFSNCTELKLNSKYSKLNCKSIGSCSYSSFQDDIFAIDGSTVNGVAKYSDIEIGNLLSANLNMFEGDLHIGKIDNLKLNVRYLKAKIDTVGRVDLREAFSCKFDLGTLGQLESFDEKYNHYSIGTLKEKVVIRGFDSQCTITHVLPSFSSIAIDGKYMKTALTVDKSSIYWLKTNTKYGTLKIDKEEFDRVSYIKENEKLEASLSHGASNTTSKKEVLITGFETTLSINHE